MKASRKNLMALLMATMTMALVACGSSGEVHQSSGTATQTQESKAAEEAEPESETAASEETESATEEAVPEPSEAVAEYLEPAGLMNSGNFSDPEAFKGFDSYQGKYFSSNGESYESDVIFGETILKDHYSGEIASTKQYADESHNAVDNPQTLDAGAVGLVVTHTANTMGMVVSFVVYNPTDAAAAFEDCLIIGFEETQALSLVFSNGISFVMPSGLGEGSETNTYEEITAALGEPFEEQGINGQSQMQTSCCWRDESGKHVLKVDISGSNGRFHTTGVSYKNFEFVGE